VRRCAAQGVCRGDRGDIGCGIEEYAWEKEGGRKAKKRRGEQEKARAQDVS
jgi:hypothetical protein